MKKKYREIVINKCWGGFGLSHEGMMLYSKLSGIKLYPFVEKREKKSKAWSERTGEFVPYINEKSKSNPYDFISYSKKPLKNGKYEENSYFSQNEIDRDDKDLVKVVKKLKKKSFGEHAKLIIVKVPFDIKWEISEYDGNESVEEKHRSWF